MKERGIIFSAPMVRALLAGQKTMTRRIVKRQPGDGIQRVAEIFRGTLEPGFACPCGQPGDRLWVREGFRPAWIGERSAIEYRADGATRLVGGVGWPMEMAPTTASPGRWRPSIYLPRWASRLTLEVTATRVERLHEITEADALAEGCEPYDTGGMGLTGTARDAFWGLWESIHGEGSWEANPWVWVISFRRVEVPR